MGWRNSKVDVTEQQAEGGCRVEEGKSNEVVFSKMGRGQQQSEK
jgi:hypothetical protein